MLVSPEDPAGSCEHLGHGRPSTFTGVPGIPSFGVTSLVMSRGDDSVVTSKVTNFEQLDQV